MSYKTPAEVSIQTGILYVTVTTETNIVHLIYYNKQKILQYKIPT